MELALLFKMETLEGKFLAVVGESAKSTKVFPLQNFALYSMILNKQVCIRRAVF